MNYEELSYYLGLECEVRTKDGQIFIGTVDIDQDGAVIIQLNKYRNYVKLYPSDILQIINLKS